jgi:hypothetical protein
MNLTDRPTEEPQADQLGRWIDPQTGQEYVLVPAEQYEKLRTVVDGITPRAGWDDPALDVYEQYWKKQ